MSKNHRKSFPENYRALFLSVILMILSLLGYGQTYTPSQGIPLNTPLAPAQSFPIDSRSMFYDAVNFLMRPYNGTSEVLSYLATAQSRFGNSIIVVDSGGILQPNGTYIGGVNNFYMFKDGFTNANLVKLSLFGEKGVYAFLRGVRLTTINNQPSIVWGMLPGQTLDSNVYINASNAKTITFDSVNNRLAFNFTGDATGDIFYRNSGGTLSRLAQGANNNFLGVSGNVLGYYAPFTLTTTGTSGTATFNNGTLNIPNYANPPPLNAIAGYGMKITGSLPNITWAIDSANYGKVDTIYRVPGQALWYFVLHGRTYSIIDSVSAAGTGWGLTGNLGTIDGTNYIGTSDNTALNFRVNNTTAGRLTSTGNQTSFGYQAGNGSNGSFATAFGFQALQNNTASNNAAFGYQSMQSNISGGNSTAMGYQSLNSLISGSGGTAIGYQSLKNNQTGANNTAIGNQALLSNVSGQGNTALGSYSLLNHISDSSTALGYYSGYTDSSGKANSFVGANTGVGIKTGSYNTILGANVTGLASGLSNNVILADGQGNIRLQYNVANLNISSQVATTDTTTYKPLAVDASGNVRKFSNIIAAPINNIGAGIRLYATQVPGLRTMTGFNGVKADSTTNVNQVTFQVDTSRMIHATAVSIRGRVPDYNGEQIYLDDPLVNGVFFYDNTDVTTADDSAMVFVSGAARWKRLITTNFINVRWFGAAGNNLDQTYNLQKAINWVIKNSSTTPTTNVYLPAGSYKISSPLLIINWNGSSFGQVAVHLLGQASNKNTSAAISSITTTFNNTFAIGIQQGKDCSVENIVLTGSYNPSSLSQISVDTLTLAQWSDGSVRTDVYSPYAGIAIDPFSDSTVYPANTDLYPGLHQYCPAGLSRSGSTQIVVKNCFITHFWVGCIVTPGNQQNGEDIVYDEVNVGGNAVGFALCQAQSKNVIVRNFQSWDNVHSLFDNNTFGIRTGSIGGGQFKVTKGNVAGNCYQLVNVGAANFKLSFDRIYAEGLFKIGIAKGASGVDFESCDFNFSITGRGLPYPDFFAYGDNLMFLNCQLRAFDGNNGVGTPIPTRLIFSGITAKFIGGTTNAPPIIAGANTNASAGDITFERFANFYNSVSSSIMTGDYGRVFGVPIYPGTKTITNVNGGAQYTLTYTGGYDHLAPIPNPILLRINKSNWSGSFNAGGQEVYMRPGDYLLNGTLNSFQEGIQLASYPIGYIDSINYTTHLVYLKNISVGLTDSTNYTLFSDYVLNTNDQFMGTVTPGTSYISGVRVTSGTVASNFPVGTRLDLSMFELGAFVTNTGNDTIYMSRPTQLGLADQPFTASPYYFMNGYPKIEIRSSQTPESFMSAYTLYGNSTYYYQFNTPNFAGFSDGPMSNQTKEIYQIANGVYNHDTSTYKLKYTILSSISRGNGISSGTTAQAFPTQYSNQGTIRVNTDSSTTYGLKRATINDQNGYRALAYLADVLMTRQSITSGTSSTGTAPNLIVTFNFASTAATYTFTMPAGPTDQQIVEFEGGGTMTTGIEVTSLTISPNSGQSIISATPLNTFTVGEHARYKWNQSLTTWFRYE